MTKIKNIRITKQMASEAAEKMAVKVYAEKIKTCKDAVDSIIEKYAIERIPAPVLACTKEFSEYFCSSRRVCVAVYNVERGYYTGSIYGNVNFEVPYGAQQISLPEKDYKEVYEFYKKLEHARAEKNRFTDEIYNALVALKTTKAVEEHLPEALEYLSIPEPTALPAPIYNNLRNLLRNAK